MKPSCLIASYGGSGSTFLTHQLRSLPGFPYICQHTHGVPGDSFLGVPVFNRWTGKAEGPLSKTIELPLDDKVIVIYRDPAQAYRSRAGYDHFMHLWSETGRDTAVLGAPPSPEAYRNSVKAHLAEGKDIMGLAEYLDRWRRYAVTGRHSILFVRYEELGTAWPRILEFLGLEAAATRTLADFSPRTREVSPEIAAIFTSLKETIAHWPAVEVFPQSPGQGPAPRRTPAQARRPLANSSFTATRIGAGASDALGRIATVYDVMKQFFDIEFRLPDYRNYHSPDVDFLETFGLYQAFPPAEEPAAPGRPKVEMHLSEMIFHLLHDDSVIEDGTDYILVSDCYENAPQVLRLKQYRGLERKFFGKLSYLPSSRPFSDTPGHKRAVAHLRRQDICGNLLFEDGDDSSIPEQLRRGIHFRPLLSLQHAVHKLEEKFPEGSIVELVVASDGVGQLRRKFQKFPDILARLDAIEAEISAPVHSAKLDIRMVGAVVGTGPEETRITLDAMYAADVVITASSSFPRLVCRLSPGSLVQVPRDELEACGYGVQPTPPAQSKAD